MIESCENNDKHDEHYWQPDPIMRTSSWCPGAAGQAKTIRATWIVVVGEPYGTITAIYHANNNKKSAETLAAGLNAILSQEKSDLRAEAREAMKPPEVDDTSSARVKSRTTSLLPDEVSIDLEKIMASLHDGGAGASQSPRTRFTGHLGKVRPLP